MKAKIEDLNKIWNEMDEEKSTKEEELKKLLTELSEYEKRANIVQEKVTKVEKALPTEAALVLDLPQMRTNLSDIKAVEEQLNALKPQLDSTVTYGKELVDGDPDIDGSNVKRRNEELEEMSDKAGEKVKDEVGKMEGLVQQMEQYLKSTKELKKDLGYVHDEVEANKPGQLDPESLREKETAVEVSCLLYHSTLRYRVSFHTARLDTTLPSNISQLPRGMRQVKLYCAVSVVNCSATLHYIAINHTVLH